VRTGELGTKAKHPQRSQSTQEGGQDGQGNESMGVNLSSSQAKKISENYLDNQFTYPSKNADSSLSYKTIYHTNVESVTLPVWSRRLVCSLQLLRADRRDFIGTSQSMLGVLFFPRAAKGPHTRNQQ